VTILFADIKGSMELLEDLDPEEARRVIDPALQLMMDAVHRYEGYVAQSTGDGIFALFGAPVRDEQTTFRAARAILEGLRQVDILSGKRDKLGMPTVTMCVGTHTDDVIVGNIGL
jgi:class 3 adenylate cyclase